MLKKLSEEKKEKLVKNKISIVIFKLLYILKNYFELINLKELYV
jgi:hypothetical protein